MKTKCILGAVLLMFSLASNAAFEVIRIAGFANDYCAVSEDCPYSLDDFGLTAGQYVYFDFIIDTELDDPANPDQFPRDFFEAILIRGTMVGSYEPGTFAYAVTDMFPEGNQTQIRDTQFGLALGTRLFDFNTDYVDLSIDTWVVGTELDLFVIGLSDGLYGEFVNTSIADLRLVYRGTDFLLTAPVPLPASVWLLLSAMSGLTLLRNRR